MEDSLHDSLVALGGPVGPRSSSRPSPLSDDRTRREPPLCSSLATRTTTTKPHGKVLSLVSLCLNAVVASLERYHADSFSILSEEDFDEIIVLRHRRTQPKEGSGGLDGTGRVAPTLSERFISEVEDANPHLADSSTVDHLVWKDCVNFRFREGGLTRPRALMLPWPLLIEKIQGAADAMVSQPMESAPVQEALHILERLPMNVSLLQATGVGKTMKKAVKLGRVTVAPDVHRRMELLLDSWKSMAERNGVAMCHTTPSPASSGAASYQDDKDDLDIAEKCQTWRQLFHSLKLREETRRSKQGERMREIRRNLASDRPKVVKVRPLSAKHTRILARPEERRAPTSTATTASSAGSRLSQLRKESAAIASRQLRGATSQQPASQLKRPPQAQGGSFGAAVAFAAASKRTAAAKKSKTTHLKLAGGKQMNVPSKIVQGAGPRQLASKFKTPGRR